MSNIFNGYATIEEIEALSGEKLTEVYAKYKNDMNRDGDYDFWESINHPETGERLSAVKGYCEASGSAMNRGCYYAEYRDSKGSSYYYMDLEGGKDKTSSIKAQLDDDKKEYEKNFKIKEKEEFLEKFNKTEPQKTNSNEEAIRRFGNLDELNENDKSKSLSQENPEIKSEQSTDIGNESKRDDTSRHKTEIDNGI